jgi:hypothetical protein
MSCVRTSARGSSKAHSSAPGSKPDRDQPVAVHKPPGVQRRRQAEQRLRRRVEPNSSRASHNANLGDPTTPPLALASTGSSRTRRLRPRQARFEYVKRYFAWSFLLPDPAARGTHAAIRSDVAWATSASSQRGNQTNTGEHGAPSVKGETHRLLLRVRGAMHRDFRCANDIQGELSDSDTGDSSTIHLHPVPERQCRRSASKPYQPATLS